MDNEKKGNKKLSNSIIFGAAYSYPNKCLLYKSGSLWSKFLKKLRFVRLEYDTTPQYFSQLIKNN